jgi:hypothetical protein
MSLIHQEAENNATMFLSGGALNKAGKCHATSARDAELSKRWVGICVGCVGSKGVDY